MLVPLYDDNDHGHSHHHHDWVHWLLILFCIAVFGYEVYLYETGGTRAIRAFVDGWSFDPRKYLSADYPALPYKQKIILLLKCLADLGNLALVKITASIFVHAGLAHLFFNILGLWFIGDNVQYAMGRLRYFIFFLLGGIVAAAGHVVMATPANFVGGIGASGAIFAVSAAYLLFFPRAKFIMFYFIGIFWGTVALPAWLVLGAYFIGEVNIAITGFGGDYGHVGVWAHVWGFAGGAILCFLFRRRTDEPLYVQSQQKMYHKNIKQVMHARREKGDHWNDWGP